MFDSANSRGVSALFSALFLLPACDSSTSSAQILPTSFNQGKPAVVCSQEMGKVLRGLIGLVSERWGCWSVENFCFKPARMARKRVNNSFQSRAIATYE